MKLLLKPLSSWLKRLVPWSRAIPTEPGYYWWRENDKSRAEVVFLARPTMGRTLYVEARGAAAGVPLPLSTWAKGEWFGPIQPPK